MACTKECDKGDESACSTVRVWKLEAEQTEFYEASLRADNVYLQCDSKSGTESRGECDARCDEGDAGACLKLGPTYEHGCLD